MVKKSEKGFTLLELVIGLGIMASVIGATSMTATTLLLNYGEAAVQCDVLPQVQNSGYWITHDVQVARNVTADGTNGFPLYLSIPVDMDENNDNIVEYSLEGSRLKRKLYDSSHILLSDTHIADYIDTDDTLFSTVNSNIGHYRLMVTASRGTSSATKSYDMSQRLFGG